MPHIPKEKLDFLTKIFEEIDTDKDGKIKVGDIATAIRKDGCEPDMNDLNTLIRISDEDNNGYIDLKEFIKMTAKIEILEQIKIRFKEFDKDKSGKINKEEVKGMFVKMNIKYEEKEINDMIKSADKNGDGEIDFQEFVDVFLAE